MNSTIQQQQEQQQQQQQIRKYNNNPADECGCRRNNPTTTTLGGFEKQQQSYLKGMIVCFCLLIVVFVVGSGGAAVFLLQTTIPRQTNNESIIIDMNSIVPPHSESFRHRRLAETTSTTTTESESIMHIQSSFNKNEMPVNLYFEIKTVMTKRKDIQNDKDDRMEEKEKVKNEQYYQDIQNNKNENNVPFDMIPEKFVNDHTIFAIDSSTRRPFPRWELDDGTSTTTTNNNNNNEVVVVSIMDSILDFVKQQEEYYRTFSGKQEDMFYFGRNNPVHTSDHLQSYVPNWWFPEALYIVESDQTIYTSQLTKKLSDIETWAIQSKYDPTEKVMQLGLQILHNDPVEQVTTRWPRLYNLLIEKNGSFPFLAHYSDFIGCNYQNWNDNTQSIPLFTVAANVHCNHTFPFPTDKVYWYSRQDKEAWEGNMNFYKSMYPEFSNKKSKLVWRGSLTGQMPEEVEERGPRWRLTKLVHSEVLHQSERDLFDVKLTYVPNEYLNFLYINQTEIGSISTQNEMKMDDFQNYKAILDVDGHSWSSRFAHLLCYNSVVVKVDPQYVDYFYFPATQDEYTLQPWKHYIPVKADMSDLIEKTMYALDSNNQNHIERIIHNANEWCAHKFTKDSIGRDVLDIWEKYLYVLDASDFTKIKGTIITSSSVRHRLESEGNNNNKSWEKQWNEIKDDIMKGPLEMVNIAM